LSLNKREYPLTFIIISKPSEYQAVRKKLHKRQKKNQKKWCYKKKMLTFATF